MKIVDDKIGLKAFELANAFGYFTQFEIMAFYSALKSLNPIKPEIAVLVNIGAGAGTSGLAMAEVYPTAKRFTVDIQLEGAPTGGLGNEINAFKEAFKGQSKIIDLETWEVLLPTQIHGDSKMVGRELWGYKNQYPYPIDFLYVDGDHSETGIRGDIETWVQHVRAGGIMVFHDYGRPEWPDVHKVVDEYANREIWARLIHVHSLGVFRK